METSSGAPGLLLDARVLRADALASLSNTALARDELDIAIQSNPDDLDLLERRCRLVFEHFPPAATEPAFRDLLARDPQNAAAQHNLGSILYKLARHDDSVAAYRESLRCRPNTASTYTHLGYALRAAGYRADAIAACQEALKLVPGDLAATEALRQVQATD